MIDLYGTSSEQKQSGSENPAQQQLFDNDEKNGAIKKNASSSSAEYEYLPASEEERRKLNRAQVNAAINDIEDTNW